VAEPGGYIESGTPAFRRISLALAALGFATFSTLYSAQPLLPVFGAEFGVSAAESSLALSLATGFLAGSLIPAGAVSDALGRRSIMIVSLAASAILTFAAALAPNWPTLLLARALGGVALSGLPAVAMAYVAEEMDSRAIGLSMGLLIGGNAMGGMAGRIIAGTLADLYSWRVALAAVGAIALAGTLSVAYSLPPSRHFHPQPLAPRALAKNFARPFRDQGLPLLFAEAFLLMGGFVTLYNYIGYRLIAAPYSLGHATVAAIFLSYLMGPPASTLVGNVAGRLGRRRVLWAMILVMIAGIGLTTADSLALVVAGIPVATFGFFGAHSVASSWVGIRARTGKGQASSLYLFFYYLGSSVIGTAGGLFWERGGWNGVAGAIIVLLVLAFAISVRLAMVKPLPT
jgi:YNFM family putative membrane transporter